MNWYKKYQRGEHWTDDVDSTYEHFFGEDFLPEDSIKELPLRKKKEQDKEDKKREDKLYRSRRKYYIRRQKIEQEIAKLKEELNELQKGDYIPGSIFRITEINKKIKMFEREKYRYIYP